MPAKPVALVACLGLLAGLPGCRMNERLSGTIMGGVGGAAIGTATAGFPGALIGGGAGALGGYLVGDYIADQRERGRPSVFGDIDDGDASGPIMASWPERSPARVMGERDDEASRAYERGQVATSAAEARQWFERSLALDAGRPATWNALGVAAFHRGDRVEAIRCFSQALRLDPTNVAAKSHLAAIARRA